ncbi:MAG: hypothetical protein ACI3Z5_04250 [Paludibacteraceae bacterium]
MENRSLFTLIVVWCFAISSTAGEVITQVIDGDTLVFYIPTRYSEEEVAYARNFIFQTEDFDTAYAAYSIIKRSPLEDSVKIEYCCYLIHKFESLYHPFGTKINAEKFAELYYDVYRYIYSYYYSILYGYKNANTIETLPYDGDLSIEQLCLYYLQKAAEGGGYWACPRLASCYFRGDLGLEKDINKGKYWYVRAGGAQELIRYKNSIQREFASKPTYEILLKRGKLNHLSEEMIKRLFTRPEQQEAIISGRNNSPL